MERTLGFQQVVRGGGGQTGSCCQTFNTPIQSRSGMVAGLRPLAASIVAMFTVLDQLLH